MAKKHLIAAARVELYSDLVKAMPNRGKDERVDKLMEICADLTVKLEALTTKHRKLCENLSINRLIDVKHLV